MRGIKFRVSDWFLLAAFVAMAWALWGLVAQLYRCGLWVVC